MVTLCVEYTPLHTYAVYSEDEVTLRDHTSIVARIRRESFEQRRNARVPPHEQVWTARVRQVPRGLTVLLRILSPQRG